MAINSACCALTGADFLLEGEKSVYSLCRPPGHHAGINYCGGFCYFNNAAIATMYLINENLIKDKQIKIAILDIDYHHGNGTQHIFDKNQNVLFVSIHADPDNNFPFYWGKKDDIRNDDNNCNINIPLPTGTNESEYINALKMAMDHIIKFDADYLVISFGADTYKNDPMGSLNLETSAYSKIGRYISEMRLPTLIIQEGGYNIDEMGTCVTNFLLGFGHGGDILK